MTYISSKYFVSGTWTYKYRGKGTRKNFIDNKGGIEIGSWQSSQNVRVKGFWQYLNDGTANIYVDINLNGLLDSNDIRVGSVSVMRSMKESGDLGGSWNRRNNAMSVRKKTEWNEYRIYNNTYVIPVPSEGNDILIGTSLNDGIYGGGGHDELFGLDGYDQLNGSKGNDVIIGGSAADRLTGGEGKDRFVYNTINDSRPSSRNRDTITDFNGEEGDRIDLRKIDGNTKVNGNQKLRFIGNKAFSGKGGEVRFTGSVLQVDNNLDRKADMEIAMTGVTSFGQNFLIL